MSPRVPAAAAALSAPDYGTGHSRVQRGAMSRELDIEDMYRRYGDLVFGRCRSLLHNEADAQEATQEVFLRVWRYRASFRGEASPATYLFKVTTTTCLNRLRTKRRRPEDPVEEPPASAGVNDTLLENVELRQLLDTVLQDADERTIQCLVYHYVDGMTHDEVGEILGVTGAAVRKRLSQFRTRMGTMFPHLLSGEER
jgi:RNA polymerase sigma-70 factor (ECF subfamily)